MPEERGGRALPEVSAPAGPALLRVHPGASALGKPEVQEARADASEQRGEPPEGDLHARALARRLRVVRGAILARAVIDDDPRLLETGGVPGDRDRLVDVPDLVDQAVRLRLLR